MTESKKPRRIPGRLEILNWRGYRDDESYCQTGVFRKHAKRGLVELVEGERKAQGLGKPVEGGSEHSFYINDHLKFDDGQVVRFEGRKWRIRVEEINDGE